MLKGDCGGFKLFECIADLAGTVASCALSVEDWFLVSSYTVWDIPCIALVMVRITLSGGVSNLS